VIRVIVADDHPMMLETVVSRLEGADDISVAATAVNGNDLLAAYERHRPDVVLTDYKMPGQAGAELVGQILELDPDARVVILTAYDDPSHIEAGIEAGAVGYLVKTVGGSELVAQVRAVAAGGRALGPEAISALVDRFRTPSVPPQPLSDRESEVLALLVEGLTNAEVAGRLYLSTETVKSHVSHIYTKLGVRDRASAVRVAIERGLVPEKP
jgi:DNA-binding NarL/FixJ family response regulator